MIQRRDFLQYLGIGGLVARSCTGLRPKRRLEVLDLGDCPAGNVQCTVEFTTPPNQSTELYLVGPEWGGDILHAQFIGCTSGTRTFSFHAVKNQRLICRGERPMVNFTKIYVELV